MVIKVFAAKNVLSRYAPEFASRLHQIVKVSPEGYINAPLTSIVHPSHLPPLFASKISTVVLAWQGYLRRWRSESQTVQAVFPGVYTSMARMRKSEAWRSKIEDVREVPSCRYMSPAGRSFLPYLRPQTVLLRLESISSSSADRSV